jgi:hypothetical protein
MFISNETRSYLKILIILFKVVNIDTMKLGPSGSRWGSGSGQRVKEEPAAVELSKNKFSMLDLQEGRVSTYDSDSDSRREPFAGSSKSMGGPPGRGQFEMVRTFDVAKRTSDFSFPARGYKVTCIKTNENICTELF